MRVRFVVEGDEGVGVLSSVSRAGFFVLSDAPPRPGVPVVLQFESPTGRLVNLRGQVRWNTRSQVDAGERRGFGVVLSEPPPEYREFFLWAQEQTEKPGED